MGAGTTYYRPWESTKCACIHKTMKPIDIELA
jgi:hypothetical protein